MTKPNKAADFLQNMTEDLSVTAQPIVAPRPREARAQKPTSTRTGLKHIGGYLDTDTVEKVAILRARLKLDNSELISLPLMIFTASTWQNERSVMLD
jgi:hypothetical protein